MMYTYFIVFYQQCFSSKNISHTESWLPLCTFCWNFYISLSFHLWTKYVWKHHRNIVTTTVSMNEIYMVIVALNLSFFSLFAQNKLLFSYAVAMIHVKRIWTASDVRLFTPLFFFCFHSTKICTCDWNINEHKTDILFFNVFSFTALR